MTDTVRLRRDPDFFPLVSGMWLRYEHTNTQFEGIETVDIRFESVAAVGQETTVEASLIRMRMGKQTTHRYRIFRGEKSVRSEGGPLGIARTEFLLPPVPGKSWTEPPDRNEIASLDASVVVPAGKFSQCLRVNTFLGGGDAGSAIRYYAPGIGYVYEDYADEAWGARIKLASFRLDAGTSPL